MYFLNDICEKNNIKYWIIGGTLLGSVREKNIITHDDDCDVGFYKEDLDKFIEVVQKSEKLIITKSGELHKLSLKEGNEFVDLFQFRYNENNKRVEHDSAVNRFVWPNQWFDKEQIDNLLDNYYLGTTFDIGESPLLIRLKGPSNPESFLLRVYGKTWKTPKKEKIFSVLFLMRETY